MHTVDEMPQFHEKYVPLSAMPSDHGGKDKTCKELHGKARSTKVKNNVRKTNSKFYFVYILL